MISTSPRSCPPKPAFGRRRMRGEVEILAAREFRVRGTHRALFAFVICGSSPSPRPLPAKSGVREKHRRSTRLSRSNCHLFTFQTACRIATQLRDLAAHFARGLLETSRPLYQEGAGNAGRPMRPIAACAMIVVERTRVSQVTPESPGIPRAMVYGLYRALPGEPGFLATVAPEKLASQELDTSVGVSGPHVFAVRVSAVRQKRIRVHRIPPNVRDDRETPLEKRRDGRHIQLIWAGRQTIFLKIRN
jgi:hypothetical protein